MTGGPGRKRPLAPTRPTCGCAGEQITRGDLPAFACRLGHRFAAAAMDEAQSREVARVLGVALRMFAERAELARRLAEAQRRRGRPVSAEHWEATVREMDAAAEVLRRLLARDSRRPDPEEAEDGDAPGAA